MSVWPHDLADGQVASGAGVMDNLNYLVGLVSALSVAAVPLGAIAGYMGAADPAGGKWLLADGRAVSRTTYATYFAKVGTTWGVGNGTTTFNIPDLRGRTPMGAGDAVSASGHTPHALAALGGEETHTLTTAQIAAHTHDVTDPGHTHTYADKTAGYTAGLIAPGGAGQSGDPHAIANIDTSRNTGSRTTGVSIAAAGGGAAHNELPPYATVNMIVNVL